MQFKNLQELLIKKIFIFVLIYGLSKFHFYANSQKSVRKDSLECGRFRKCILNKIYIYFIEYKFSLTYQPVFMLTQSQTRILPLQLIKK